MKNATKFLINAMLSMVMAIILSGCAGAKPGQVADWTERAKKQTAYVCGMASELESMGLEVPGAKECRRIAPLLNSREIVVFVELLKCLDKYAPEERAFAVCSTAAGYDALVYRVEELTGN